MGCCAKFGLFFQQRHFAQRSRDCLQWTCLTRRLRWGRLLRPLNPSNPQPCRPFVKVRPRCCKRRTWASTSPLCSEMSLRGYRRQGSGLVSYYIALWQGAPVLCDRALYCGRYAPTMPHPHPAVLFEGVLGAPHEVFHQQGCEEWKRGHMNMSIEVKDLSHNV